MTLTESLRLKFCWNHFVEGGVYGMTFTAQEVLEAFVTVQNEQGDVTDLGWLLTFVYLELIEGDITDQAAEVLVAIEREYIDGQFYHDAA